MSEPLSPKPVKLFAGILFTSLATLKESLAALTGHFGPVDFVTAPRIFTETSYYEKEMGKNINRVYLTFKELIDPEMLVSIKLLTNDLEKIFRHESGRSINIDPGCLSEERLVLATGKNYTHRLYLGKGIYGDLTLIYQKGSYRPLPWTYPDYRDPTLLHFLKVLRKKLVAERKDSLP